MRLKQTWPTPSHINFQVGTRHNSTNFRFPDKKYGYSLKHNMSWTKTHVLEIRDYWHFISPDSSKYVFKHNEHASFNLMATQYGPWHLWQEPKTPWGHPSALSPRQNGIRFRERTCEPVQPRPSKARSWPPPPHLQRLASGAKPSPSPRTRCGVKPWYVPINKAILSTKQKTALNKQTHVLVWAQQLMSFGSTKVISALNKQSSKHGHELLCLRKAPMSRDRFDIWNHIHKIWKMQFLIILKFRSHEHFGESTTTFNAGTRATWSALLSNSPSTRISFFRAPYESRRLSLRLHRNSAQNNSPPPTKTSQQTAIDVPRSPLWSHSLLCPLEAEKHYVF